MCDVHVGYMCLCVVRLSMCVIYGSVWYGVCMCVWVVCGVCVHMVRCVQCVYLCVSCVDLHGMVCVSDWCMVGGGCGGVMCVSA